MAAKTQVSMSVTPAVHALIAAVAAAEDRTLVAVIERAVTRYADASGEYQAALPKDRANT